MPKIGEMKVSKFLKKEDLGEDEEAILTIRGVSEENVGTDDKPDVKWALHFRELPKPMVLNWTNMQLAAAACGSEDTDDWTGKKVLVYYDPSVMFKGELKGGLRIRKVSKGAQAAAAARAADDDDIPF